MGGGIKMSAGWSHWNADCSKRPSAGEIETTWKSGTSRVDGAERVGKAGRQSRLQVVQDSAVVREFYSGRSLLSNLALG